MTADAPDTNSGEPALEAGTEQNAGAPAIWTKWRIAALAAVAAVVLAGVIGAVVFLGGRDEPGTVIIDIGGATVYQEFPEILTQLGGGEGSSDHVKLEIIIEIPEDQADILQDAEPVITDAIQSYLRGKTRADLAGEAGAERLRSDLVVIINQRIAPAAAKDILFKTFLID